VHQYRAPQTTDETTHGAASASGAKSASARTEVDFILTVVMSKEKDRRRRKKWRAEEASKRVIKKMKEK
jgi:hypothetical protein